MPASRGKCLGHAAYTEADDVSHTIAIYVRQLARELILAGPTTPKVRSAERIKR